MKRVVELPPDVVPRVGPALAVLALADVAGEAAPVGDPAPSATLAWVLATGGAAAFPARDGPPQPATTATIAAARALANAERHRQRGCR
jgi:hypothetical protein